MKSEMMKKIFVVLGFVFVFGGSTAVHAAERDEAGGVHRAGAESLIKTFRHLRAFLLANPDKAAMIFALVTGATAEGANWWQEGRPRQLRGIGMATPRLHVYIVGLMLFFGMQVAAILLGRRIIRDQHGE